MFPAHAVTMSLLPRLLPDNLIVDNTEGLLTARSFFFLPESISEKSFKQVLNMGM